MEDEGARTLRGKGFTGALPPLITPPRRLGAPHPLQTVVPAARFEIKLAFC